MKIYCTGASGNLGRALVSRGCIPFEADVTNFDRVREEMLTKSPDVLIHLVGPAVDIEDYDAASRLVIRGTANVIDKELYPRVRTIYISSSHVFDGKRGKYRETDKPNPINDYGLIKLGGEAVASQSGGKIIRLSTCFNKNHKDIVEWREGVEMAVGMASPYLLEAPTFIRRTYAHIDHVAEGIMSFAERWEVMPKVMNISGTEDLSEYEFLLALATHYGWNKNRIEPRKRELVIEGLAKRPHKAGLNVNLARKYGIPLYSAYQGIDLL